MNIEEQNKINAFRKKVKGGLKKCPLHFYGGIPEHTPFEHVIDSWFRCLRCHSYVNVPECVVGKEIKIYASRNGIIYETPEDFFMRIQFS